MKSDWLTRSQTLMPIIRDVDLDPLDTDDHSLEFLVKRVDSSR